MTARKRTPIRRGHLELMVEEMRSQNRATLEAVQAIPDAMALRFDASVERVNVRLDAVEAAVREHSRGLTDLTRQVQGLRKDLDRVEGRIETLADRARVDALERRVTALESTIR